MYFVLYLLLWEEKEYIKPKNKCLNLEEVGQEIITIIIKKNVVKNEWKDIMKKLTTDEFIKKSKEIHGKKYDYSKSVYIHGHKKVIITCLKHGDFEQMPYSHLQNHGCKFCNDELKPISVKEFIKKAKFIHGDKYDYSKTKSIPTEKKHRVRKVTIICKKHGEFIQFPQTHLDGCGCKKCYDETHKLTNEEFILRSKILHGNVYDYSKTIYIHPKIKVKIICKRHGIFDQLPFGHLSGQGCVKCTYNISKKEIKFLNYLKIPNTINNRQKRILGFNVDGFKNNTIYEFLGDYWHGNPKIHNRNDINKATKTTFGELYDFTFNKFKKLKENGYRIKYMWESDWDDWKESKFKIPPILEY